MENRMFRYEVEGMRQTYENDQLSVIPFAIVAVFLSQRPTTA